MENIHEKQVGEVSPYQFEPEVGAKTSNLSDESDSEQGMICLRLTRKSMMSLKEQMLGAFKLLVGVNVDIALYQQRLLNVFVVMKKR